MFALSVSLLFICIFYICFYFFFFISLLELKGVMRLKSLEFLFKSARSQIGDYITNLLNKFEVALQFDKEYLLLPSLLPTETELLEMARRKSDVRVRSKFSDPFLYLFYRVICCGPRGSRVGYEIYSDFGSGICSRNN